MIRILLVEDDKIQLQRMKQTLEQNLLNYEIHEASSVEQAIDIIKDLRRVSLVVTDYLLGGENGYQLLEFCQNALTDVPVIIITAHGKDEEQEVRAALSFQKGAFDFMHKPLDPEEFIERIKHALKVAQAIA
jgi:DNA-binding NtrC family response regulator